MNYIAPNTFKWIVITGLAVVAGSIPFFVDLANMSKVLEILLIGFLYLILHIRFIGRDPVLLVLAFSVGWLSLCQSPLYVLHYDIFSTGRWIVIGATAVLSFLAGIQSGKKVQLRRIVIFPFLMGGYFYLSRLWSVSPEMTVGRSISVMMLSAAVIGVVWYMGNSTSHLQQAMKAILLPIIFLFWVLIPIYGFNTSLLQRGYLRTAGPMLNPNGIGVLGAFLAPIAYYLCRTTAPKNIVWLGSLLTCIFMVLISGTRSALSAIVFAFILIVLLKRHAFSVGMLFGGAVALVLSIGFFVVEVYGVPDILQTYLRVENLPAGSGRLEAWSVALDLLPRRLWTGYGFGTEDVLFEQFGMRFLKHSGAMVHNSYLGLSLQIGILGALVFFIPMFLAVTKGIQVYMSGKDEMVGTLTGTLIAGLVISLTESWLYSAGNSQSLPFWILFGVLVRLLIRPKWGNGEAFIRMPQTQDKPVPRHEVNRGFR